jgi:hypothetical protein
MKIDCSNCMTTITVDPDKGTATYTRPGQGQGRKRIPTEIIVRNAWDEDGLLVWEAPCCPDYVDSFEEGT